MAEQLQVALDTRIIIEQAKSVLTERGKVDVNLRRPGSRSGSGNRECQGVRLTLEG